MITLKTLHKATDQQVFDQVATHLLTQLRQAEKNGNCQYRTPGGLKCAAGCLIADDEYSEDLESNGWSELTASSRVPVAHSSLICSLQNIHDEYDPVDGWYPELYDLAENLGLSTTVLNQFIR